MTDDETTKKTGRSVRFPDRLGASTTRVGIWIEGSGTIFIMLCFQKKYVNFHLNIVIM